MKRNKRGEKKRAKMLMKRNTRETSWWNETHRERERETEKGERGNIQRREGNRERGTERQKLGTRQ